MLINVTYLIFAVLVVFISRVLQSLWLPAIWLRHHPLRGVDSVRLQILSVGTCRQCGSWSVAGHNRKKVIGEAPFVQICTTWTLIRLETVQQRPCMTREIETWLLDSRVGYNSVFDHRNRWPAGFRGVMQPRLSLQDVLNSKFFTITVYIGLAVYKWSRSSS